MPIKLIPELAAVLGYDEIDDAGNPVKKAAGPKRRTTDIDLPREKPQPKPTKFVSNVLDQELKRQTAPRLETPIPNPQTKETNILQDVARKSGLAGGPRLDGLDRKVLGAVAAGHEKAVSAVTPMFEKMLEDERPILPMGVSPRGVVRGATRAVDALDAGRGAAQAAAMEWADNVDEKSSGQLAVDMARAAGKSAKRTIVDEVPEQGFASALRERGVEIPEWQGLLVEGIADPTNLIPGKLVSKAALGLLPMALKGAKAVDAAGDVARGAAAATRALPAGATPEAVRIANATSRNAGAVGANAVVPRVVRQVAQPDMEILDFGAGKAAAHAQKLREEGFNVRAHDFGDNVREGLHDPDALSRQHDLVYASNVLNTQSSPEMLRGTIDQIHGATRPGGRIIVNLPASPRKFEGLTPELVETTLRESGFDNIMRVGGTKSEPVFSAIRPVVDDVPVGASDDILRQADELELVDDADGIAINASGESAASGESISRYSGMLDKGKRFAVREPSGQIRVLPTGDYVDFRPRGRQEYGVLNADGSFDVLQRGRDFQAGAVNPALLANIAGTAGGGLLGAAANADSEIMPGGALTGALAGAAGGHMLARGAVGLVRGASKTAAVAANANVSPQVVAQQIESAQPTIERLIHTIPERPEALDVHPRSGPPSATADYSVGKAKRFEDEARREVWLRDRVGVTDAGERRIMDRVYRNGEDYYFYKQRRMHVSEPDPVTGEVVVKGRSWQETEAASWKRVFSGYKLPKGTTLPAEDILALERGVKGLTERAADIDRDLQAAELFLKNGREQDAVMLRQKWGIHSQEAFALLADQAYDELMVATRGMTGVRSELGRSLNILKKKISYRKVAQSDEEFIKRAAALGVEGREIRQEMRVLTHPEQRYKYLRDRAKATSGDMFRWYYISSLLSGPKTHARNLASNAINILAMDTGAAVSGAYDVARGRLTKAEYKDQMRAMLHGQKVGIVQGWKEAVKVWQNGFSTEDAIGFAEKPPEIRMSNIFGTQKFDSERTTRYLNSVSRFLEASDQVARTMVFSGAIHQGAYREASRLLRAGKIQPHEFLKKVDNIVRDPELVAPKVFEEAVRISKDAVYRQDAPEALAKFMGFMKSIDKAGQKHIGGRVAQIKNTPLRVAASLATAPLQNMATTVMPFVKTPFNVYRKQARMLGGGFWSAGKSAKQGQDMMAAIQRGEAILGTSLMGALGVYALASDKPFITGAGPFDAGLSESPSKGLDAFYGQARPHSFRVPFTDTWVDYRAMAGASGVLSVIGNLSDSTRTHGGFNWKAGATFLGRQMRSQVSTSFLSGVMGLLSAFEDRTGTAMNRFVGRTIAGFTPASGALRGARNVTDDVVRDTSGDSFAQTVGYNVANILPGVSSRVVPARVDYAGKVIRQPGGMNPAGAAARVLNPFDTATVKPDEARKHMAALGPEAYYAKPEGKLTDDITGEPMDLTRIQSTELQKVIGQAQAKVAESLLTVPAFRAAPASIRAEILADTMAKARKAAKDAYRIYVRTVSTAQP